MTEKRHSGKSDQDRMPEGGSMDTNQGKNRAEDKFKEGTGEACSLSSLTENSEGSAADQSKLCPHSSQEAKEQLSQMIDEKIAKLAEEDAALEAELIRIQKERQKKREEMAAIRKRSREKKRGLALIRSAKEKASAAVDAAKERSAQALDAAKERRLDAETKELEALEMAEELAAALELDSAEPVRSPVKGAIVPTAETERSKAQSILNSETSGAAVFAAETEELDPAAATAEALERMWAEDPMDFEPEGSLRLDEAMDRLIGKVAAQAAKLKVSAVQVKEKSAPVLSSAFGRAGQSARRARDWICTRGRAASDRAVSASDAEADEKSVAVLAAKTAGLVDQMEGAMDRNGRTERHSGLALELKARMNGRFRRMAGFAKEHRALLIKCTGGGAVAAAAIMLVVGHLSAYEYMYNGKVLGMVKDRDEVYKTVEIVGDKMAEAYNAEISIDKDSDITFRRVIGTDFDLDDKDDILNSLTYLKDMKVRGYGIYVEGEKVATLESKEAAQGILDTLTDQYVQQNSNKEYKEVGFLEDVDVKPLDTKLGKLQDGEDVMQFMLTGAVEKKTHVVQKGQTFSEIAHSYGLSQGALMASNPGVDPNRLQIDQELTLTQDRPVLTVKTVEVATYKMPIPFGIDYENSNAVYKGEQSVKLQGQNGRREVTAEIVRVNGQEQSRTELNSQVLSNPVNQVVLVGTKEKPTYVASGNYIYPVRGRLSSRYGARWGRMHNGVDLAVAAGTSVSASNSGTVTFAGWNGALGYCVKISHGDGVETWYGHCSKLLVKTGQKVMKGDAIAKAGSTGNSTGPHVHFEVHVNGKTVNPLSYL